jgi:hypothetical protein
MEKKIKLYCSSKVFSKKCGVKKMTVASGLEQQRPGLKLYPKKALSVVPL